MKFSWTSFKISVAGAKLSHLAQKDKIWDHGSMVELVKNIFYKIEKARMKNDVELIRKSVTEKFYLRIKERTKEISNLGTAILTEVFIINVKEKTNERADQFIALIKGKRKSGEKKSAGIENFSEQWLFVREGEWWLLEEVKAGRWYF